MAGSKEVKKAKKQRSYPRISLEEALKIAVALKEKNGGNPWPPEEVARAVGSASASSSTFFYQTSASQAFGLTKGTRDASRIELASLGRNIVYAPGPTEELENKRKAFFGVELFKKVFDHYGGSKLPETKYLSNTLENEFGLSPEFHEEFVKLFQENCKYLGIESEKDLPGSITDDKAKNGRAIERTSDAETILLSEAKDKGALLAFVIMPFSERSGNTQMDFLTRC
jgi:hypothetical protein